MSHIIFISGPSGMGKTKIKDKLENLEKVLNINFERVIITTSRSMRPGESQGNPWYFKSADDIEKLYKSDPQNYLKVEIRRGEPQGLDTDTEIVKKLSKSNVLWCELHITWLDIIENWININIPKVKITKVFFAPLSKKELIERSKKENLSWDKIIEAEMTKRLIARRDAGLDNISDDKLKKRAFNAIEEYSSLDKYDCIIINHQGEESQEWGDKKEFPTGEASRVFTQFLNIYKS